MMDCLWITAKRAGALTAVPTKYVARSGSELIGMLGRGVQGRRNLEAVNALFPLETVDGL
jgi:ornithine cyclodeaminase/alanine dehydrogenase-like protein (mu-crystallin family)